MEIIQNTTEFHIESRTAVAIGKFDGIHRGHEKLLSCILEQKMAGMQAVVFTFFPSAAVFFGQAADAELTTREEKRKHFEKMGIDILIEFPLNQKTAAILPEEFVRKILVGQMHAGYIAAGTDLSFGYKGRGDQVLLNALAPELHYQVHIIDKVFENGREISSTYVREMVEKGDMITTRQLLGRPYSFEGQVERGNRLGRRMGMPTLNLYPKPEKLLPPKGVYYSRVLFEGGTYPGITNIGQKPTVNDTNTVSVETYLYDFDRDMYGKEIVTELLQFKRPEKKFEDIRMLKLQMETDIAEGRKYHEH
ncbi:MAG: bifunctional riboflavin kinase/FAD synthetase [Lachnospiraceae bacterium]|nr:bifunctional riboflavin kinase/FAD synthetase [Lachnospiraceae bacterium]